MLGANIEVVLHLFLGEVLGAHRFAILFRNQLSTFRLLEEFLFLYLLSEYLVDRLGLRYEYLVANPQLLDLLELFIFKKICIRCVVLVPNVLDLLLLRHHLVKQRFHRKHQSSLVYLVDIEAISFGSFLLLNGILFDPFPDLLLCEIGFVFSDVSIRQQFIFVPVHQLFQMEVYLRVYGALGRLMLPIFLIAGAMFRVLMASARGHYRVGFRHEPA